MVLTRALLRASWQSWLTSELPRVQPRWLYWVWTGLFSATIAAAFTVLAFIIHARNPEEWMSARNWTFWYGKNLVIALTIGATIHLMSDAMRWLHVVPQRTRRWKPWQRSLFFSGVPLLGVAMGWPLGVGLAGLSFPRVSSINAIVGSIAITVLMTAAFHNYFAQRRRQLAAERRATEAQLRLLQGQIEPHFLFNTLANVQSLIDHDAPRAKLMLESFTDYLRSSLGALRLHDSTLGAELDLAQAYLALLKMRMEDRLQFVVRCDDALRGLPMPPLLLQPLVENAIHHGLEPKVEGGTITITARREGRQLLLQVADDGLGLHTPSKRRGAGVALANLRERLQAQFPGEGNLELQAAEPGTLATLRLPIEQH